MPTLYSVKPRFQRLLRPAVVPLSRRGVTPNGVTASAAIGSILVGLAMAALSDRPLALLLLPAWLGVRMALNALDGLMARELALATRAGAAANEVADVVSDLALYLPLAFYSPAAAGTVIAFAIGAVIAEFCGVLGPSLGAIRQYAGPMGKSDRALFASAVAVATAVRPDLARFWPPLFTAAAALAALTGWNRVAAALAEEPPPPVREA